MPFNEKNKKNAVLRLVILLLCSAMFLSACRTKEEESGIEVIDLTAPTPSSEFPIPDAPIKQTATASPTLLPVTQSSSSANQAGLIIFSMADGAFKHLFAYHPSYLPVTRITADAWDDESPSISPNGDRIAYTSNRFGQRDVFILDLVNNTLTQMTNSPAYEGKIDWSNDGNYIVYDVYQDDRHDLIIQSVTDTQEPPIQLTDGESNYFQPAWSPDGKQIAFVTDQSGRNEIWLARLQDPNERFLKLIGDPLADYENPAWSPDGSWLAVSRQENKQEVLLISSENSAQEPLVIGYGKNPVWLPDGSGVLVTIESANDTDILAYAVPNKHMMLPPIKLEGGLSGYDWNSANLVPNLQKWTAQHPVSSPEVLWKTDDEVSAGENGRRSLITLEGIEAPNPALSDSADDRFYALRDLVEEKSGWDFLGILENATLPATSKDMPSITENWLFTGRAIGVNLAPYEAGWMVVSKEEFAGELYWRVWIKCKVQDGTCGQPISGTIWDFNSRFSGDIVAYENGGRVLPANAGYWVDFTELASRCGWERIPSQNNWRSYFPGIQFNVFVFRQNLSWTQALLEIYPPDQVAIILGSDQ